MRLSHILPACLALLLLAGVLVAANSIETQQAAALYHVLGEQPHYNPAFQSAAFRRPDVLMMYGSSEVVNEGQGQASDVLAAHPRGFSLVTAGMLGSNPFTYLQDVAAAGPAVRGEKVVVSVAPDSFQARWLPSDYYRGHLRLPLVSQLVFSPWLSEGVKREAARTLAHYGHTLTDDPLLGLAVDSLASGTPRGRLTYYALLPLGLVRNGVERLLDHARVLSLLYTHRHDLAAVPPSTPPAEVEWDALADAAEAAYIPQANDNSFGILNRTWQRRHTELEALHGTVPDAAFVGNLTASHAWDELDLLLRALQELGAEPLIISPPMKGVLLDDTGTSREARQVYYDRLRAVGARHGVPVVTFEDFDADPYFGIDLNNHLSPKGWVYYARALDAFYHDQPLPR